MLGEGIGVTDLLVLLQAVRNKKLTIQVKILDGTWEDISAIIVKEMISAINAGRITKTEDIRLRLFQKD